MWLYRLLDTALVPEALIRLGIKILHAETLREQRRACGDDPERATMRMAQELRNHPVAIETDAANAQHYELPTRFFKYILGPRMKYSCAYWPDGITDLALAEEAMLALTCERAEIEDGQIILDLGCGWGALSLWLAQRYPHAQIVAVSNSRTQKEHIDEEASRLGLDNLSTVTANVVAFNPQQKFDRVLSVEMFEHMKNYQVLLSRIRHWLNPRGRLFVHIFSHRKYTYHYQAADPSNWLARHFFSGGLMPSDGLLLHFQDDLQLVDHWILNGIHYHRTLEAWLSNMAANKDNIMPVLAHTYGQSQAAKWWVYWRTFFLACSELFRCGNGSEWVVSHYSFLPSQISAVPPAI